jgi:hypothetical protein
MGEFSLQKFLALLFVLLAGFIVAWSSFSTGTDIIHNTPKSKIFESERKAQIELQKK